MPEDRILEAARRLSVAELMARPTAIPDRATFTHDEPEPPYYSKRELHILAKREASRDSIGDAYARRQPRADKTETGQSRGPELGGLVNEIQTARIVGATSQVIADHFNLHQLEHHHWTAQELAEIVRAGVMAALATHLREHHR